MSEPQQIINIGAVANDGTGESLRDAFNAVNNNFANIWAAGPVNSQISITNNRISTTEPNLDLILAGNGTGNVTVASTLVPSTDSVYELGSPSRYFDTTYSRYFYGNGRFLTGISGGGSGNGANVTFSVGPPAGPSVGDIWIEADTGVQYLYFNDNTSNQWAEMEAYQSFSAGTSNGGSGNVDFTAVTSNIIPTPGNVYSIGNTARPWQNMWLANTLWLGNTAVVMTGNTLTVNGNQVLTGNSSPQYNNISVVGNVRTNAIYTNNYFYANGSPFSQGNGIAGSTIAIYGNVIETTVTNQNLTLNPNGIGVIQANASYVPSVDSVYDIGSSTNRINSVYARYFYGNGSQLTGLPTGYSNSQVSNYLASGTNTANIITTANVNGNYILGNVISATTFSAAGNIFASGSMSVVGNLYVSNVVTTGNLVVYDPLVYFVANTTYPYDYDIGFYSHFVGDPGNTYQHTGFVRDYTDNTWKLFSNVTPEPTNSTLNLTNAIYDPIKVGNLTSVGNVSATYFTGNGSQLTGIVSSYGNSNVVANLAALGSNPVSTTGNVTSGNLILSTGNLTIGNINVNTSNSAIQGWSYSNVSKSVATEETASTGIYFKSDGTSMYIVGTTSDKVFQYNLSSAWDVSTATVYGNVSLLAQDNVMNDLFITSTGTTLYAIGATADAVFQYTLSTPWDITTATYASKSFSVSAQETSGSGLFFSPDLVNMYVEGSAVDTVFQYTLATPGDVSTASYSGKSFVASSQEGTGTGLAFDSTGTKMFLVGSGNFSIYQYNLATAWDVSTASYTPGSVSYVGWQDSTPAGIYVNFAVNKVWFNGQTTDAVYQLNTDGSAVVTANATALTGQLNVVGNVEMAQGLNVGGTARVASTLTVGSTTTLGSAVTMSTTTSAINIGTSQSTGTLVLGGTSQTGNINIGRSTASQGIVIGNGVTASGSTKTIDIGTLGAANSATNINIGPTAGNATVAFLSNAQVSIANTGGAALSVVGNINGGNLRTVGVVTATGNVYGGNTIVAGSESVTGNITGGNIQTAGLITATGNITGGNIKATTTTQLAVYANTTVRDSTITSPQPGMMIYVTGTGMQVRGATSWNTIAGSGT